MIDIHSHILPGVDDGAQTIEDAIKLAKEAVSEGITKIIATPHHHNGKYTNKKEVILSKVVELNDILHQENIPLEVLPGQETRIYGELLEDLRKGDILPLNKFNYLFIELPSGHVPRYTEKLLFEVQLKGLTPVIVHPERNTEIIENSDILYNLVSKGVLTQITSGSVVGKFGKKIQKFTMQLIDSNLTHFIASDAHNTSTRSFHFSESLSVIEKEFGSNASLFFCENAEYLIKGQAIYKEAPSMIKRKKLFGIF
ncbi:tyrosine protein phosphatase [Bacillus sp. UMB0899]|uniref:tyrosine-protein phosphatase n=1 Tax=Metabacillus schmidteae TaxID=2730405 RepID=UPI000C80CD62|nr:CpsB/CapC family capsule biosynthesis tyrosine phosphatase [Metabacillus schmidteae]PMC37365.1 tyrosine protein phosphatase [Bacillus sp. UMB0899]